MQLLCVEGESEVYAFERSHQEPPVRTRSTPMLLCAGCMNAVNSMFSLCGLPFGAST